MKLTQFLCRRNLLPNGHIFRGKDRLVRKVTPKHLRVLAQNIAIEEQNMFYLRFPYLTEEESKGHAKALGRNNDFIKKTIDRNNKLFKEDITLYERLSHLKVKEDWD